MAMVASKSLARVALWLLYVSACASEHRPVPDQDGLVVLELTSRPTAAPTALPTPVTVAVDAGPADLESCVQKVRRDPFPAGAIDATGMYLAGIAAEERNDTTGARKLFFDLIQAAPTSPFRPPSYFAFGELFRAEARADPSKLQFARQVYDEVIKYPPDVNPLFEIAMLRKAELAAMAGEAQDALSILLKLAQAKSFGPCSDAVGRTIEVAIVPIYAAVGDPGKATMFFKRLGNAVGKDFGPVAALRLARLYTDRNQRKEAQQTLRGLASDGENLSPGACADAIALASELGVSRPKDFEWRCKP